MKNLQITVSQKTLDQMAAAPRTDNASNPNRIIDEAYLPAAGKMNRSQRRALAKLQRKDVKLSRKIKQLESNLKRKPR